MGAGIPMTINPKDIEWWSNKIYRGTSTRYLFNGQPNVSVARHARRLFEILLEAQDTTLKAACLKEIQSTYGISVKYFYRAVASVARWGKIKEASLMAPTIKIIADIDELHKPAPARLKQRARIPNVLRTMILEADGYRCSHCGKVFEREHLAVDHIIPASLLGADEPGNWATLCGSCNGAKSDQFKGEHLTIYRGRVIKGNVGMRFSGGCFWPFINGKTRKDYREDWVKKRKIASI